MSRRIWELDALRGLCVLGMVAVHLGYDLGLHGAVLALALEWGGVLFLLLSGICVTLGSHPLRRGLTVFACGMLCSAVTWGLHRLGLADSGIVIRFGVLHCLGCCMLLWPLLRRLPDRLLAALGASIALAGLCLWGVATVRVRFLYPLGLVYPGFSSSDFFPLLPNLGFFLLGSVLGRRFYGQKRSLLPGVDPRRQPIKLLCACGRHSLLIYLLHQPILTGLLMLVA